MAQAAPNSDLQTSANDNAYAPRGRSVSAMLPSDVVELRRAADTRVNSLETQRTSWLAAWKDISRFLNPRLGRYYEMPQTGGRGQPKQQRILDETAIVSSERFASGLMAGVTSPARPWFDLSVGDHPAAMGSGVKLWLDAVRTRMMKVLSGSNFYRATASYYEEIGAFGTAVMLIYEDFHDVIRCYPMTAGEYYLANDNRLEPTVFGRKFVMTVQEMVGQFGRDAVSSAVRKCWDDNQKDQEFLVAHLIQPNERRIAGEVGPKGMKWQELYWEYGSSSSELLAVGGFNEKPFMASRWNVTGNDAYGRSQGMTALPAIKQLQVQTRRKGQIVDKLANPPMVADSVLKNEPASVLPGGVTYLPSGAGNVGFKPAYEVDPKAVPAVREDIATLQARIKTIFFEDLFLMVSQLDTVRTATEIAERKEEKMLMLGPALERLHDEFLRPAIERVFAIMLRHSMPKWARGEDGLLPQPPAELADGEITIEFISTLAQAQKAVATTAIERLFAFAGGLAAVKPEVMDNLDADEAVSSYADYVGAPPKIVVPAAKVAKMRAARQQAQQQNMQLQQSMAAAQGAKTLSETDVGGGMNALQKITGMAA